MPIAPRGIRALADEAARAREMRALSEAMAKSVVGERQVDPADVAKMRKLGGGRGVFEEETDAERMVRGVESPILGSRG